MRTVEKEQILDRIRFENPWWQKPHQIDKFYRVMPHRAYFELFFPRVIEKDPKRAVVLMGPRRVGKTVIIHQSVQKLLDSGVNPKLICYLSIDHPIYNAIGLEELFLLCREASGIKGGKKFYMFFDEIQYLKEWEIHLKSLVDSYHQVKFIASGSSAAALKLKSTESGAGRFSDFLLPPLTFFEYIKLIGEEKNFITDEEQGAFSSQDIKALNNHFIDYINYGGYPEAIFSDSIKADPQRHIKRDIIDKVLLRDLPSLYGIQDIQELNSLFTTLAYNTSNEVSLEGLSQSSGVAKNTIKRYIKFLEAAFLIKVVHRIDKNAKKFKRATTFKVYLTNPSIWTALFSPVKKGDDKIMGFLAETAVFAQLFHLENILENLYYARWKNGEIDMVYLPPSTSPPPAVVEIKWSDRHVSHLDELKHLIQFCHKLNISDVLVTTKSYEVEAVIKGIKISFIPTSLYCLMTGYGIINLKKNLPLR